MYTQVQDLLLEFGVDIIAETLTEGLSRVKRCTDEGRALMSLDLQVWIAELYSLIIFLPHTWPTENWCTCFSQVLINGLKHFIPLDVRPKLQIVEAFIKASIGWLLTLQ